MRAGARRPDAKRVVRNPFTPDDNKKISVIAAAQQLELPSFTISSDRNDPLNANSRFVGVWSNKRGWTNGKGRYAMLIVTEVSATGLAKGYYLWGPPTKQSWAKDVAGYKSFAEFIIER